MLGAECHVVGTVDWVQLPCPSEGMWLKDQPPGPHLWANLGSRLPVPVPGSWGCQC